MQSPKDPSQSRIEPGHTEPADPRAGDMKAEPMNTKAKPREFRLVDEDGINRVVTEEEFKAAIEGNREKANPPAQNMLGSRLVPQWLSGMASMLTEGQVVPVLEVYLSAHTFDVNVMSDFHLTVDPSFDIERFEKAQEEAGAEGGEGAVVYDVATRELSELVLRVAVQAMLYAWGRFGGPQCLDPHGIVDHHSLSTAGATAMGLCSGVITAARAVLERTTGERPSIARLAREVGEVISNFEGMPIRQRLGHAWHGWEVDVREEEPFGRWFVIATAPLDSKADRVEEYEEHAEHGVVTRVAYGADDLEAMANSIEMAQDDMRDLAADAGLTEGDFVSRSDREAFRGSTAGDPPA